MNEKSTWAMKKQLQPHFFRFRSGIIPVAFRMIFNFEQMKFYLFTRYTQYTHTNTPFGKLQYRPLLLVLSRNKVENSQLKT